jgi:hypothetical protein
MKRELDGLGETQLSAKVESLEVWGRCSCGGDSCSSFYTGPRPKAAWSGEGDHRNIALPVHQGIMILDVVEGEIRYVEVLDRPDVEALIKGLPALSRND